MTQPQPEAGARAGPGVEAVRGIGSEEANEGVGRARSASRRVSHSAATAQASLAAQELPGVLAALDAAPRFSHRTHSCGPRDQEQRQPCGAGAELVPPRGVRRSARGLAAACRRLGYDGLHRVQPASPAPPRRDEAAHGPAWFAPIRIDRLHSWCSRTGNDPASGSARSSYAAEPARTAPDALIVWPPARNAPCWCNSGRKYKQCCGHPSVAATPAPRTVARGVRHGPGPDHAARGWRR